MLGTIQLEYLLQYLLFYPLSLLDRNSSNLAFMKNNIVYSL